MSNFEFNWKYEDFEIRTHSASTDKPYIELVKWDGKSGGKKSCYVLAFFHWNREEGGEWNFVGNRPFEAIADVQIEVIWKQMWYAAKMFVDWREKEEDKLEKEYF